MYRKEHAEDGVVDVVNKRCAQRGCGKLPSFGMAGSKVAVYRKEHAEDDMVDVVNECCRAAGLH